MNVNFQLALCKSRLGLLKQATDPYGEPATPWSSMSPRPIQPWSAISPPKLQNSTPLPLYGEAIGSLFGAGNTGLGALGQLTSPITRLPYEAAGQGAALDAAVRRADNPSTPRDVQRLQANLRLPIRDANESLSGTVNQSAQFRAHVTGEPQTAPAPTAQPAANPWYKQWWAPVVGGAGAGAALMMWMNSRKKQKKPVRKTVPAEEE